MKSSLSFAVCLLLTLAALVVAMIEVTLPTLALALMLIIVSVIQGRRSAQ